MLNEHGMGGESRDHQEYIKKREREIENIFLNLEFAIGDLPSQKVDERKLSETARRFGEFIADEEEEEEANTRKTLRDLIDAVCEEYFFNAREKREAFVKFLTEVAHWMSDEELDELRRFVVLIYEQGKRKAISDEESEDIARVLIGVVHDAEDVHVGGEAKIQEEERKKLFERFEDVEKQIQDRTRQKVRKEYREKEFFISLRFQDFFKEIHLLSTVKDAKDKEKRFLTVLDRFRDFLSDEVVHIGVDGYDDDVLVAREIEKIAEDLEKKSTSQEFRLACIRLLCESIPAMSVAEYLAVKRCARVIYCSRGVAGYISKKDAMESVRMLVRGIKEGTSSVSFDGIGLSEDEMYTQEAFEHTREDLERDEHIEEIQRVYALSLDSGRGLSPNEQEYVLELLKEEDNVHHVAIVCRALRLWNSREYESVLKSDELSRLRGGGIEIDQDDFERENLFSALQEIFLSGEARDRMIPFSLQKFFPGRSEISSEKMEESVREGFEELDWGIDEGLRHIKDQEGNPSLNRKKYFADLFGGLTDFFYYFISHTSPERQGDLKREFQEELRKHGGEAYRAYLEDQRGWRDKSSSVYAPTNIFASVPDAVMGTGGGNRRDESPLHESVDDEVKRDVINRLQAGGLLHLAEEIHREKTKKFEDILRNPEVQQRAREMLCRMIARGNFGIVERSAPVFLGDSWFADEELSSSAKAFIVDDLVHILQEDGKGHFSLEILATKARLFHLEWVPMVDEARARTSVAQTKSRSKKK